MSLEKECTVIITTFFSGDKLDHCLNTIPNNLKKIIIDNGCENNKKKYYENKFINLHYILPENNIGIPSSYQLAWRHVDTPYIFQTQPDVILEKNCIEELYLSAKKYPNFGILSPIIFHNNTYTANGNYFYVKYNKEKKKILNKIKFNKIYDDIPDGDISVDAVSATSMFIDTEKLREIKGWDTSFFAYFEDVDLCLRFKSIGYDTIKIKNAKLYHQAFSSHKEKFHKEMDYSRNFHYSWSKIYFISKYEGLIKSKILAIQLIVIFFLKFLFYFILINKKKLTYLARLQGSIASFLSLKPFYRPKIEYIKNYE